MEGREEGGLDFDADGDGLHGTAWVSSTLRGSSWHLALRSRGNRIEFNVHYFQLFIACSTLGILWKYSNIYEFYNNEKVEVEDNLGSQWSHGKLQKTLSGLGLWSVDT